MQAIGMRIDLAVRSHLSECLGVATLFGAEDMPLSQRQKGPYLVEPIGPLLHIGSG
jgi:hypothetical protein